MRFMDFSSWHGVLTTIGGLLLFTLVGVGIRVLMMLTIQQRQQRMNRQINERLRTLIAAYKVLGGSFTGTLSVDPSHVRDQRRRQALELEQARMAEVAEEAGVPEALVPPEAPAGPSESAAERARRVRDAVEAALADIILLGTEEHVRLAARAASDMAAGTPIHTAELVTSLRNYIRNALDLGDIPEDVVIPSQGPTRPASPGGGARGGRGGAGGEGGGGGGGGGAGGGAGGGGGMGMGLGLGRRQDDG